MTDPSRSPHGSGKDTQKEEAIKLIEELGREAFEHLHSNRPEEARAALLTGIALSQKCFELRLEAVLTIYMAQAEKMQGEFDEALTCFATAIDIAKKRQFTDLEVLGRMFHAELLKDLGHFTRAFSEYELAYSGASYLKDFHTMELAAGQLGSVSLSAGHLEQASGWFKTALDIAQEADSSEHDIWLGSLGLAMSELGQFEKSCDYYEQAFSYAQNKGDYLTMSICRGSIGNVRFEEKNYEEACSAYEEARQFAKEANDLRRQGIWLGNIGIAKSRLGTHDEAIELLQEAISLARNAGDNQSEAAHLDSLGDCYKVKGDPAKSDECYKEALAIARRISDHMGERIYLSNLGRLKSQNGELNPAFEYFKLAVDLFDEQRGNIKADDLKTSFANRGQELYRDIVSTCLKLGKRVEAIEYVGRAKSRALLDLLSNSPIDVSDIAASEGHDLALRALITREADLRAQIANLERLYWQEGEGRSTDLGGGSSTGPSEPPSGSGPHRGGTMGQEDTRKLYGQWRDVLNQLKRRHPNYASLVSTSTLKYCEIQDLWLSGALSPDTCIIEFFLTPDYLLTACAIAQSSDNSEPVTHSIMDENELACLRLDIETFLEMSSTEGWEVPVSLCKRLYNRLLGPIIEKIPDGIKRLILVPHGILYHLPFSALHDGKGYLCEKFATGYVPTVSLIPILATGKKPESESTGSYLVSAISDYSKTREGGMVFSSRLRSSSGLEDLAYTMEEANSIVSLGNSAQGATLLTNEEVKSSLPSMFGKFEVVHFAGHAIFNHDEPLASGLVLSDGSILSAASILEGRALRTKCGRLLVLSACQTGVNVVTEGGEILGLARALMYAGMPNLVLSLWEVADRSTASLMQDFHLALLSGWHVEKGSIAEALRQAQLKAIAQKQPIHAWAPFIHFGIE